MDAFEAASVQRDSRGHIYQLNHLDEPYRPGSVVYPAATDNSSGRNPVKFPYFTLVRRGICDDTQPIVLPAPFGFPRLDLHHAPRLVARLFQSYTCQALQARSTST